MHTGPCTANVHRLNMTYYVIEKCNNQGQWDFVCNPTWSQPEAKVICRQSGLCSSASCPDVTSKFVDISGFTTQANIDFMSCSGTENNTGQCSSQFSIEGCGTKSFVVLCTRKYPNGSSSFIKNLIL